GQRLTARQQQRVLNAQRMQITQQQRRLLSRRKIEVNRGPVEFSFENFFRRFVKAQEFSEQSTVIVEAVDAVKKVEPLFQTLVMQECLLFQPGQDHIGSLAVIESGLSNLYANDLRRRPTPGSIFILSGERTAAGQYCLHIYRTACLSGSGIS